ncbi:MAG: DUF3368 domain-containing protein [Chloroflexi bacterium]|nr:MAG: DUF3368 domain-containing protein [Chloroflexota bacterium]
MLVIADSSALVSLAVCQSLDVLLTLYDDVKVPQAVYDEVVEPGKSQAPRLAIFLENRVVPVDMARFVFNAGGLGQGELEAMALYKELSADVLLIDDRRARAVAEHNQIACVGALGVLLLAKDRGVIERVKPAVDALRNSSIYYGEELLTKVLELANE